VIGGGLTFWFGPRLLAAHLGLPPVAAVNPKWLAWTIKGGYAIPGLLAGALIGWFLIRPVNGGLGWFFRNFNRGFDAVTAAYGWTVSKALRRTFVVLGLYVVLLGLTYWEFQRAPTGFIPQQDQGRLLVTCNCRTGRRCSARKKLSPK